MDLNFNVNNQTVIRSDKNKTVNWSDDYLRLCFNFESTDWTDCSKFILIFDDEEVYRFALTDNKFIVPEELLTGVKLIFSVYGVNNSFRITTPKILVRLEEAGYSSDVKDLDVDEFTHDVVEEVYIAINSKADSGHTHVKSEITDFAHNHDDRYYTETEVNAIIYGLNNKIKLDASNNIIQTSDKINLRAYVVENGMPKANETISFYINEEDGD